MVNLQKRIDTIFDYLYASSEIKNTESLAYEFSKILHTGIYIEQEKSIKPAFKNYSFSNESNSVEFVRNCFFEMNEKWELYDKNETILFSDSDISYICSVFKDIELSDKTVDFIGDSLEIFRNYSIKSLGGQFFTDPKVTKLALDILGFKATNGERFVDICAGTGGFLLAAINKTKHDLEYFNENKDNFLTQLVLSQISGKEIDETVRNAANRNIQARLGIKQELVDHADSLTLDKTEYNKYDCIATNPPFGSKTMILDESKLKNYELAHKKDSSKLKPTPPDILFLEQNLNLLKPGTGKMAIVLPYQILSGPKTSYIRKWILSHAKVLAVIDLPAETFQPHTGTKTSLLVVEKYEKTIDEIDSLDYDIFFAKPKWVGHDRRGLPVYKKNFDGTESDEILCDFDLVKQEWDSYVLNKDIDSEISKVVSIKEVLKDELMRLNALVYIREKDDKIDGTELKNLVSNIFYPGRFKRSYVSNQFNAVPFLGGANITELIVSTKKYISKKDPHYNQLAVKEGWILITRSGTTGIVSIVPKAWDGFAISEHVIRIIPDSTKEDPDFIYAFLQSEMAKRQLSKQVFGSVIDEISPDAVGNLIVPAVLKEKKELICNNIATYKKFLNDSIESYNNAQVVMNSLW